MWFEKTLRLLVSMGILGYNKLKVESTMSAGKRIFSVKGKIA